MRNKGFTGTILTIIIAILVIVIGIGAMYVSQKNNSQSENSLHNQISDLQDEVQNLGNKKEDFQNNSVRDFNVEEYDSTEEDLFESKEDYYLCGNISQNDVLNTSNINNPNLFHKMNLECVNDRWRFMDMQCPQNWNYYFINSDFSIESHEKGECTKSSTSNILCGGISQNDVLNTSNINNPNLFHKMNLECVNDRWRFMDMQCPQNWNFYFINSDFSIEPHEKGDCTFLNKR